MESAKQIIALLNGKTEDWTRKDWESALHTLRDWNERVEQIVALMIPGGSPRRPPAAGGRNYRVINDIVPLVRESEKPLKQSEIFELLKLTIMHNKGCTEDQARVDLYRSLAYHTARAKRKGDRGVRAVKMHGTKATAVDFVMKDNASDYPDNLIWHADHVAS